MAGMVVPAAVGRGLRIDGLPVDGQVVLGRGHLRCGNPRRRGNGHDDQGEERTEDYVHIDSRSLGCFRLPGDPGYAKHNMSGEERARVPVRMQPVCVDSAGKEGRALRDGD